MWTIRDIKLAAKASTILPVILLALLSGCQQQPAAAPEPALPTSATVEPPSLPASPTSPPTLELTQVTQSPPARTVAVPSTMPDTTAPFPTPIFAATEDPCGQLLPLVGEPSSEASGPLSVNEDQLAAVLDLLPEEARPALEYIIDQPHSVALAAYRVDQAEQGVFLNAEQPMPLASVVKIIHLVAYAEAVAADDLLPTATISVADVDRYYLPTLDLRAHNQALEALEADGRLFGDPPALLLDEVVRMMIEFSSNAATDYMHMLLGQTRIEQTVRSLEIEPHTAPCPFVGQFLAMANHTRPQLDGQTALQNFIEDPQRYGQEVMQLTAAYSTDETFHQDAVAWRQQTRRPHARTQRLFTDYLNAQGTALAYARLMARLAQNGLSSDESSFIARRHLEWPMRFAENQERFSNLGYKGGSLPGILTTAYYAYPQGEQAPRVVTLFFRDLPGDTYRQWRSTQAHDELARWLLYEPQAIPALRVLLSGNS